MADQRTMAELLRAPTEGYAEAIVVPPILAEHFELKHSLINMMTSDNSSDSRKTILMITFVPVVGSKKEPPRSILTWEDLVSKFINEFFPSSRTTNLRNEISNFEQRFGESFHEARDHYKDLLRACPHHAKTYSCSKSANECCDYRHDAVSKTIQGNPPSTSVKPFEEICVTCGGAHPYYQCLATDGNTFPGISEIIFKDTLQQPRLTTIRLRKEMQTLIQASMSNQTNELKNMMASFFQMNTASTSGTGSLPSNTVANPRGELKAINTRSGLVLDGTSIPMPPPFINPEEDERVEETLMDPELAEYTIKVPPPLVQKAKPTSLKNYVVHQKMLKSLLSNKEKLLELANTPLNENCSAVILKKLPEKLGDPGKFLIPCGFSELKCKALADLGASINLMPLSVWKKLGLPKLISTRMTLELANRAICTPAGIARDVFVPVGKFTFPADFVIVDYESDPRVPLILGRPFLRTARALIDVHGEEMILRDGDERLILNMRHDTSSYSNKPKKESINMIDIYNVSHDDYLEDLFANEKITNHLSGNPTLISDPMVSSSPTLTSLEESDLIWEEFEAYLASDSFPPGSDDTNFDQEGDLRLIEELLNDDPSSPLPLSHNPLSGSTTSSSPDHLLEEFADELTLITFPPGNDDLPFDIESDLREIEYFLNHDPNKEMDFFL
ncbi:reverse transcriptase domain-containing protein [Tanacetum coccineum]